jgi:hypothetical protein
MEIEVGERTVDGFTGCNRCPSIDARIMAALDLDGRRAMLERIESQRGADAREAVEASFLEIWNETRGKK